MSYSYKVKPVYNISYHNWSLKPRSGNMKKQLDLTIGTRKFIWGQISLLLVYWEKSKKLYFHRTNRKNVMRFECVWYILDNHIGLKWSIWYRSTTGKDMTSYLESFILDKFFKTTNHKYILLIVIITNITCKGNRDEGPHSNAYCLYNNTVPWNNVWY